MSGAKTQANGPSLILISLLGFTIRAVIAFNVSPLSDVFYVTREATLALLNLQNPYQHIYSSVPSHLLTANSEGVFPYLPFTALYLIPFQFFTLEIRLGLAFSDAVTSYCLGKTASRAKRRIGILLAVVYAFSPPSVLLGPLYGSTFSIAVSFFALSLLLWQQERFWLAGISYGLSLASSQWIILSAPFIYLSCYRSRKFTAIYLSWALFLFITLPFLLHDPREFMGDLLFFQMSREALPVVAIINSRVEVNLGFSGLARTLGFEIPLILKIALIIMLFVTLMIRADSSTHPLKAIFLFVLFTVLLLPNIVFSSYYLFPLTTLMLHLAKGKSFI